MEGALTIISSGGHKDPSATMVRVKQWAMSHYRTSPTLYMHLSSAELITLNRLSRPFVKTVLNMDSKETKISERKRDGDQQELHSDGRLTVPSSAGNRRDSN